MTEIKRCNFLGAMLVGVDNHKGSVGMIVVEKNQ